MRREIAGAQAQLLHADRLAEGAIGQTRALAHADGRAAAQVGEREGGLAVAAPGGAEEGEEGRVLRDGEKLSVGRGVAIGDEVAAELNDLAQRADRGTILTRKNAAGADEVIDAQR